MPTIVAEDIVIRHQKRFVNIPGKPGVRLPLGRDADIFAADTVVEYGSDVKMWSESPREPQSIVLGIELRVEERSLKLQVEQLSCFPF